MEQCYKEAIGDYMQFINNTRYQMWYEYILPTGEILNNSNMSDFEKIEAIKRIKNLMMENAKGWKPNSAYFGL